VMKVEMPCAEFQLSINQKQKHPRPCKRLGRRSYFVCLVMNIPRQCSFVQCDHVKMGWLYIIVQYSIYVNDAKILML